MFRTLIFIDQEIGQLDLSVHNFDPGCSMHATKLEGIPVAGFPLRISGCGLFSSLAKTKICRKIFFED